MKRCDAEKLVRTVGWLASAPPDFQDTVLEACDYGPVPDDALLYSAGDDGGSIMGVAVGRISVWLQSDNGDNRLAHIMGAGAWFGDLGALLDGRRRVMIRAREGVWRFRFLQAALQATVRADPANWKWLNLLTSRNYETCLSAIEGLLSPTPVERVTKTLLRLSRADPLSKGFVRCSQSELGSMTVLSRSGVITALAAIEASGAIRRHYNAIQIVDMDKLSTI